MVGDSPPPSIINGTIFINGHSFTLLQIFITIAQLAQHSELIREISVCCQGGYRTDQFAENESLCIVQSYMGNLHHASPERLSNIMENTVEIFREQDVREDQTKTISTGYVRTAALINSQHLWFFT